MNMFAQVNVSTPKYAKWLILGIPNEKGSLSNIKNYSQGPEAIRDASYRVFAPLFSENYPSIYDLGDIDLDYEYNLYEIYKKIQKKVKYYLNKYPDKKFVFLGGDHSITYPILKEIYSKKKDIYLLYFDAHPDLHPDPYINYQSFIYYLIKEQVLDPSHIIMIGVSNMSFEEKKLLKKYSIKYYTPYEIWDNSNKVAEEIANILKNKKFYLSLDLDVFESAPGHWIEPFGINWYHFFKIIFKIKEKNGDLISFDVVELYPEEKSENLAIKIILELISLF